MHLEHSFKNMSHLHLKRLLHRCETQPKIMADFCAKTCHDLIMSMSYFKSVTVDDDDEEQFFDLTAKNWTGSTLHFGSFDGYVSIEYI